MGQPITVIEKPSRRPGVRRFELNRPMTGMGHERYVAGQVVDGVRPVDELARRLLGHGGVDAVHANSSVVTVVLARGSAGDGLAEIIENLFIHYGPDAAVPTLPGDGGSSE